MDGFGGMKVACEDNYLDKIIMLQSLLSMFDGFVG